MHGIAVPRRYFEIGIAMGLVGLDAAHVLTQNSEGARTRKYEPDSETG